jgi:hypothetical protein
LCLFTNQAAYQAALDQYNQDQIPWGDARCPLCPPGYDVSSNTRDCRQSNGGGGILPPTGFEICTSNQYCDLGASGGCQDLLAGCQQNGLTTDPVTNVCGGTLPYQCTAGNQNLCCPNSEACSSAGGSPTTCLNVGILTGSVGDCDQLFPNYPITCNASNFSQQRYYCCASPSACSARGGVGNANTPLTSTENLCAQTGSLSGLCQTCNGIWTAIGCIPATEAGIATAGLRLGLGIGGGAALLLILIGSFFITTSRGQPDRLQSGRDLITSAIIGLLLVIFSVVGLQFLGVTILQIPGF